MKKCVLFTLLSISYLFIFTQDHVFYFFQESGGKTYYLSSNDDGDLTTKVINRPPGDKETFYLEKKGQGEYEFKPYFIKSFAGYYLKIEDDQLVAFDKDATDQHLFEISFQLRNSFELKIKKLTGQELEKTIHFSGSEKEFLALNIDEADNSTILAKKVTEGVEIKPDDWLDHISYKRKESLLFNPDDSFSERIEMDNKIKWGNIYSTDDSFFLAIDDSFVSATDEPELWSDVNTYSPNDSFPLEWHISSSFENSGENSDLIRNIDVHEGEFDFRVNKGVMFIKIWNRGEKGQVLALNRINIYENIFNNLDEFLGIGIIISWKINLSLSQGEGLILFMDGSFRKL